MLHSEFRDGNVSAGHEQLRVLIRSLAHLPVSVARVSLRSHTAGYQEELLLCRSEGKEPRFGAIDFAIALTAHGSKDLVLGGAWATKRMKALRLYSRADMRTRRMNHHSHSTSPNDRSTHRQFGKVCFLERYASPCARARARLATVARRYRRRLRPCGQTNGGADQAIVLTSGGHQDREISHARRRLAICPRIAA
jgi:hypothetical protein